MVRNVSRLPSAHGISRVAPFAASLPPISIPSSFRASQIKAAATVKRANVSIVMDSGRTKAFPAFRVQHQDVDGRFLGGVRLAADVTEESLKAHALGMTLQCALLGIPFGGSAGGVVVDPKTLSAGELERLCRGYVRQISRLMGAERDVLMPELNTDERCMSWMFDEYAQITPNPPRASVLGKPLAEGGTQGRDEAVALGGYDCLTDYMHRKKITPKKTRIAIQGFGRVGQSFANFSSLMDCKIVALSNSRQTLFDPDGLDIPVVTADYRVNGHWDERHGILTDSEKILVQDCDVLVLAARENQIDVSNQARVRAPIILELAYRPITQEADRLLEERGHVIIPDILANAAAVANAHFEWQQNTQGETWDIQTVRSKLLDSMYPTLALVIRTMDQKKISMRKAALQIAFGRLA